MIQLRFKSFIQLLQPNILVNFSRGRLASIRCSQIPLLFFLFEDFKQYFLLNLRHFVHFFHHPIQDINDGSDKIVDACRVVKT